MNLKLPFGAKDRKREFFSFGNVTKLFWKVCFVSAQMQKWIRAHPYNGRFSACTLRCTQTLSPDSQETVSVLFVRKRLQAFLASGWNTASCRTKSQENSGRKKWMLTRRTVSKLLGFQDKAGIIPRLGCIIKPMLKLGISVSCGKQMGKIA